MTNRHLDWDGCFNARDLGGLPTTDGRHVARGTLVRADALDHLSEAGWSALERHGIRTIIDLRNDDERLLAPSRPGLTFLHLPLDAIEDTEFWSAWTSGWQFGTPLYYGPHIERFPERSARVVASIAAAPPGGVVVHCGVGRDRTGLVMMLVLALLGVAAEEIALDHSLSGPRLPPLFERRGEPDQGPLIEAFLAAKGTTGRDVVVETLRCLDVESWMLEGGLDAASVAALRSRLLREA